MAHLHPIEQLGHLTNPPVLLAHQFARYCPLLAGDHTVEGNHQNHHAQPGEDRRPHEVVQEIQRQANLIRRRPEHVDVRDNIHEALRVNRHEVDNFSARRRLPGGAAELQGLVVHGCNHRRAQTHARYVHAVEVLVQCHRLHQRHRKHGARELPPRRLGRHVVGV